MGGANVGQVAGFHNQDQVRAKDERGEGEEQQPVVRRAGDVIPEVVGPVPRSGARCPAGVGVPDRLPVSEAEHPGPARGRGRYASCRSRVSIPGAGHIEHFAGRGSMDIESFGEQRVRLFLELGLLSDIAGMYESTGTDSATSARS